MHTYKLYIVAYAAAYIDTFFVKALTSQDKMSLISHLLLKHLTA